MLQWPLYCHSATYRQQCCIERQKRPIRRWRPSARDHARQWHTGTHPFLCNRLGQSDYASFCHSIVGLTNVSVKTRSRRDIDDASVFLLLGVLDAEVGCSFADDPIEGSPRRQLCLRKEPGALRDPAVTHLKGATSWHSRMRRKVSSSMLPAGRNC